MVSFDLQCYSLPARNPVALIAYGRSCQHITYETDLTSSSDEHLLIRLLTDVEAADRRRNGGSFARPVRIDDDVWIGMKANILPGSKSEK